MVEAINHAAPIEHPCGIKGDHVGRCEDCGAENVKLGWAHTCRPCWDAWIASCEEASADL